MIARLTGKLERIYDDSILLEVHGIAYRLLVSAQTIFNLPAINEKMCLWIETILRNEQPIMCGFIEENEAKWFQILTKIQGVGGKVALNILGASNMYNIYVAIQQQDVKAFTRAEGVGPKLASRILLELKNNKNLAQISGQQEGSTTNTELFNKTGTEATTPHLMFDLEQQAHQALLNMGFNRAETNQAITSTLSKLHLDKTILKDLTIEEFLKLALKECYVKAAS